MATDKFPQRNVNMPMDPDVVEAARARLAPPRSFVPETMPPANGKGSRREVRKGEWIDDRVIVIGGPSSPSTDSPPELPQRREAPPASYDPATTYSITLGKPAVFCGRVLSPAKIYQMTGDTCTQITTDYPGAIIDAVVLGSTPDNPDIAPSAAKTTQPAAKSKKA
jgi:hypothetical protein